MIIFLPPAFLGCAVSTGGLQVFWAAVHRGGNRAVVTGALLVVCVANISGSRNPDIVGLTC